MRHGFTLLELLLVLAAITSMTAVSLPALQQAKAKAMAVVCTTRQRQVWLAAAMYAAEADNWWPYYAFGQNTRPCRKDAGAAQGLLGLPDKALTCPDTRFGPSAGQGWSSYQTSYYRYAIGDAVRLDRPFLGVTLRGPEQQTHVVELTSRDALLFDSAFWPERRNQRVEAHGGRGLVVLYADGHGGLKELQATYYGTDSGLLLPKLRD